MPLTVYKYSLPSDDYFQIELPGDAKILTMQTQHGNPQIWALLDPSKPPQSRYFRLAGTGHPISEVQEDLKYIDTCQVLNGKLIFHLFEITKLRLPQKKILQINHITSLSSGEQ